jgi:hypothetical protein
MAKAKVRFRISGQIYKLSERETARLLDYCHRLGVESIAARLEQTNPEPHELTRDEKMGLWQAIDRLWLEEEGIQGFPPNVLRLRDALHGELNE